MLIHQSQIVEIFAFQPWILQQPWAMASDFSKYSTALSELIPVVVDITQVDEAIAFEDRRLPPFSGNDQGFFEAIQGFLILAHAAVDNSHVVEGACLVTGLFQSAVKMASDFS